MEEIEIWFKEGLKFKCTGCGKCCTGPSGYVFLSNNDIEKLAERFGVSIPNFLRKYTRLVDGSYALLDRPGSGDCIFLKNKQCTVYEDRPVQCRTFPWWLQNLRTANDWQDAAEHCEGINHPEGKIVSSEEIQEQCLIHLDNSGDF